MPRTDSPKAGDVVTYMLAVALAAGSIGFAGYKVFKLHSMENPPADLGLNFPPPKRKMDQRVLNVQLVTLTNLLEPNSAHASSWQATSQLITCTCSEELK